MRRLFFGLAILGLVVHGSNWTVEEVILPPPWLGVSSVSIATDATDRPHMAFTLNGWLSSPFFGLGYAKSDGDSWEFVSLVSGRNTVVLETEIRLDADGYPHIGYIGREDVPPYRDSVRHARFDGNVWHFETVTGPGRHRYLSMALARDGTPHMTFLEDLGDSGFMRYARRAGDTWNILTVPTEHADTLRRLHWSGGTLALDTNDRPGFAISWYKNECAPGGWDSTWLAVLEYDGREWHRFEADSGEGWGVYCFWQPKIQCDPATNLFHITHRAGFWPYWEKGVYVTGRGYNWRVERDVGVSVGNWWYDFALHEGRPHIACASAMYPLVYQWRWAGGWEEERVADDHIDATDVSIAVDREGRPHIAIANSNGTLFYARRQFVGVEEPDPVEPVSVACNPTIVRGVLRLPASPITHHSSLITSAGRKVMELQPGDNDVLHLAPGIYFVREHAAGGSRHSAGVRKVVIQR